MKRKMLSILIMGVFVLALIINLIRPSFQVQAAISGVSEEGLVAYWNFDDNYSESASGLTTNLGAKKLTYTEGIYGKAAVFNGIDNYLVVGADPVLNLGNDREKNNDNLTISAWVNLGDTSNTYGYLLDKGFDIGWDKNDNCYWTNPYRVMMSGVAPCAYLSNDFEDTNDGSAIKTEGRANAGSKYVEGEVWFLLTITNDAKGIKIYHDKELLTQTNYTDGITFNDDDLYIGVDGQLKDFFKGAVDDLRIYSRCLSYDEVGALYDSGLAANKELVEPTKQLVAYYAFDDNLNDSSNFKNDAEKVAVGGTTKYIVGKNGKAITMSKGNYILVPAADQLNFDTEFSASFWIKLNTKVEQNEYPILYRQNPSNGENNDNDWTYRCYIETWAELTNTKIHYSTNVYDPNNWDQTSGQSIDLYYTREGNKIKSTDWVHYTVTYKEGEMKTYLNGKLKLKDEKTDLINISNASGDLLVGYDGNTFINGAIDELKIYNSCLSATEVKNEYTRVDSIKLKSTDINSLSAITKGDTLVVSSIICHDVDLDKDKEVKLSNKNFTFISSNKKIFTVASDGTITGVKDGNAKLTITYGGNSVTYKVEVKSK